MNLSALNQKVEDIKATWRQAVANYQRPKVGRSVWQLINSLVPYFGLMVLMYFSLDVSYWLTLLLAVPAAGFMVRIFIIFHDCGHGSFFKSRRANDVVGFITGVLTVTPYRLWRHRHAVHHATAANLDKRGTGDVWTMTIDEYQAASPWKRFFYRVYRYPIFMFGFGPLFSFIIGQRFVPKGTKRRERWSVYWNNLVLLAILVLAYFTIGLKAYFLIQVPIIWIGAAAGIWLFYVQHQFEGVYWSRHEEWDFVKAGLEGSSFYKLPKVIQWFTGNIGFHHIHHLSPRIPNYELERCHKENKIFQVRAITLKASLKSLNFRLWDEKNRRLISFRQFRMMQAQMET